MKKWLIPMLCALPFVGIAIWFIAGKNAGNALVYGLILACPLSHVFLMRHNHEKEHKHDT
ncbi:DUF2933 domain-containing protein [Candidatus Gottesmanbacteria bacterium]|nr:DUF2933 domain-containing protein [Candidatus Gottesmanbacteria bacterium]